MSSPTTLKVVQHTQNADAPELRGVETVAVEELLKTAAVEDFDHVYNRIREGDIEPVGGFPLYDLVWSRFGFSFAQNAAPPMAITHLVVLYGLLEAELMEMNASVVECGDLDPGYQAVLVDLAAEYELELRGMDDAKRPASTRGFLAGLWGVLLVVLDQVFSLFWRRLQPGVEPTDTVFVPLVNRFDSMRPVLDAYEGDCQVVLPSATLAWLRDVRHRVPELREYDPVPVNYFITAPTVANEVLRFGRLAVEILLFDRFEKSLRRFARAELDVPLDETLSFAVENVYRVHLRSLPNLFAADQMLDALDPERLVAGSMGSLQLAILHTARERGLLTYHVPHTATTGYELAPPPDTVHFVPGSAAVDHLRDSEQVTTITNLVPAGRPQLAELYDGEPPARDPPTEPFQFVVATQPFDDRIRQALVEDVLAAIRGEHPDADVVVKIHPNESPSFYADVTAEYGATLVTDGLHDHLRGADLVFTINSNVGLEAMVLGTPVTCVNEWSPLVRTRPYAASGPVPVLESAADIESFVADLTPERLVELRRVELDHLHESYVLAEDPAEAIAGYVREGRSPADDDESATVPGPSHSR